MKKFIITIDTEGDNLWDWKTGKTITTYNTNYLQRFQRLCDEFGFLPVWLSNWEMIHDPSFVDFLKKNIALNHCELGMHLHAWNNPPIYELPFDEHSGQPYLIEYPLEIMEKKIAVITNEMKRIFGICPITHRAGRWAINEDYFRLLYKYGYKVDCSITPGIDWRLSPGQTPGVKGIDYRGETEGISEHQGILEIPLLTKKTNHFFASRKSNENLLHCVLRGGYYAIKGKQIWLRPDGKNLQEMLYLADYMSKSKHEYLMFMLHSSELMPGGSPTFKAKQDIERLYKDLRILFNKISKEFEGITLEQFYSKYIENQK